MHRHLKLALQVAFGLAIIAALIAFGSTLNPK